VREFVSQFSGNNTQDMHFFHCNKLTPIRGSKSYISVMESSGGDRSLLTAEALRLLMVIGIEDEVKAMPW